ncbi:MAG: DNA topoisomerase IV subunit A [Lentisphaerae bacterium]|nr:DNA topoisomerase IV subunit A [Lentisphaerota bacterium]
MSRKPVTPPPRRVTQELFLFDEDGKPAVAPPAPPSAPETAAGESAADDAPPTAPAATPPGKPPAPPQKPHDAFDENGNGNANGDDEPPAPAEFVPAAGGPLAKVMDGNFLQFASYTICNRAIPTVEDGLKPVQRRILHSLHEKDDGRFIKVANIIGHAMQYHPHGDASIGEALVNLANKRYLIEGQGNFGNIYTGDGAAAPRYIECRLTQLARDEIFNKKTTQFIASYDGRNQEPLLLPSKLPLLLMLGAEGIAVGLSTLILPHNFMELLEAEIAIIQNKPFQVLPDFQTGGLLDLSEYSDGNGRITTRARLETRGAHVVVIREIPFGQTTETLIASIEEAARRKKIPVKSIQDATADKVEIIITLIPGSDVEKAIAGLYAFTKCECKVTTHMVVIENNRPCERTVSEILRANVRQLLELLERELHIRHGELEDARHEKTLVQIFIEEHIYKRIEKCTAYDQIQAEIRKGFAPFKERLYREITDDDIEMLLQVRIRRISLYDRNRNREELEAIMAEMAEVEKNLAALKPYAVRYLKELIRKYKTVEVEIEEEPPAPAATANSRKGADGETKKAKPPKRKLVKKTVERFPRMTEITTFNAIEIRAITATNLTMTYDRETGFMGGAVKSGEELFKCSPLDKLILVWPDGRYKLVPAPGDKLFVDKDLLYAALFDRDRLYTAVYTEKEYPFTCLKRFAFGGTIMNRDYALMQEPGTIRLFTEGVPKAVWIKYKPAKGQRIMQKVFNPEEEVAVKGVKAKGKQITSKPIQYIAADENPPRFWDADAPTDKGRLI